MRQKTFFILVLFFPLTALADLVLCGEVWTNGGCEENVSTRLEESQSRAATTGVADSVIQQKRALLVSFQSYRRTLQNDFDFYLDTLPVDEVCLSRESQVKDCRDTIREFEGKLEQLASLSKDKREKEKVVIEKKQEQNLIVINDNGFWNNPFQRVRPVPLPQNRNTPGRLPPHKATQVDSKNTLAEQLRVQRGTAASGGSRATGASVGVSAQGASGVRGATGVRRSPFP